MLIHRNLRVPVSIGDEASYQNTVTELIESWCAFDKFTPSTLEEEKGAAYRQAQIGAEAAWNALTSAIDSYCARRVMEALGKS